MLLLDEYLLEKARLRAAKITDSQRVALEAGDALIEQSIFEGNIDWDTVLGMEKQGLTPEEEYFINDPNGPVETLCRMMEDWGNYHPEDDDVPEEIWTFLKENGFMGMVLPKEYGGLGFTATAHAMVVEKLASTNIAGAVTAMVPNSLGIGELLMHHGTQEQKDKWLPRLARGEIIPCFGLTEPEAGSDALNVQSTGEVYKDPESGEVKIRLSFEKRYITLAPKADVIGLAVQLKDPDNLLGHGENPGITTVIVEADTEGVQAGKRHKPVGGGFRNGPLQGHNVVIPAENIMGEPGQGWAMLMQNLGVGRAISIPSLGIGIIKPLVRTTGAYAAVRYQFAQAVGNFEGVKEPLAAMAGDAYRVEAGRRFALDFVDVEGKNPSSLSVIMKYWGTELARDTVTRAIDIESGKAVMQGPLNHVAKYYLKLLISIVGEGSNIMMRNLLIFGQGAVKSHPHLLAAADATEEALKAKAAGEGGAEEKRKLRGIIASHLGQAAGNSAKSFARHALPTGGVPTQLKGSPLESYVSDINRMASMFSATADACLLYLGGDIQFKERTSARLGDALSHLYMAISCVRRFEQDGRPQDQLPVVKWALEDSLKRAEVGLRDAIQNLPLRNLKAEERGALLANLRNGLSRGAAKATVRGAVLPWGMWQKGPSDELEHEVAELITRPGAVRDALTAGVHWPDPENSNSAEAVIERALLKIAETEKIEREVAKAVRKAKQEKDPALPRKAPREAVLQYAFTKGAIDADGLAALQERDELRRQAVAVDVFTPEGELYTKQWAEDLAAGAGPS